MCFNIISQLHLKPFYLIQFYILAIKHSLNPQDVKWSSKSSILVVFVNASCFIFHLTPPPPPFPLLVHLLHLHCPLCSVLPLYGCPSVLQALAQAIKEAKEQHPDMSVTRVVVHKETELAEEED